MITASFRTGFKLRKISLKIDETRCTVFNILYLFGIRIWKQTFTHDTLLSAENNYDELCERYSNGTANQYS